MIRTLIVMTTYGQIFYSKEAFFGAVAGDTDISLTAGLISAIYNMTAETQQQRITELELENLRSVFKELPGEKLFIITVDKRMDTDDADDMLADLSTRFVDQYGDRAVDGMILNDFEPTVNEVVDRRLWYNIAPRKPKLLDLLPFLAVLFCSFFYPKWLLQGETTIIHPLQVAYQDGFFPMLLKALIIGVETIGPIVVTMFLLKAFPNFQLIFKFIGEFLRRPTRGGYAEVLPWWFLSIPLITSLAFISVVRFGRGLQYALTAQAFIDSLDVDIVNINHQGIFWYYGITYLIIYLITWFIIFPFLVGLITDQLSRQWFKSSMILISIAFIPFLISHIIAGVRYQNWVNFHPGDFTYGQESTGLRFLFMVTLPINLFLFLFIFVLGVGMSQLVKKNRDRYPIGFGISIFFTFALQNILFFLLFNSGILLRPLFI